LEGIAPKILFHKPKIPADSCRNDKDACGKVVLALYPPIISAKHATQLWYQEKHHKVRTSLKKRASVSEAVPLAWLATSLKKNNDFVKDGDSSTILQLGKLGGGT
jgi:hypothetical protein